MSEPSAVGVTTELFEILKRLFVYVRHRLKVVPPEEFFKMKARLEATHPISRADYELLLRVGMRLMREQEPITMGELSRALDVPLSTATRIVDCLVAGDFAERLPDPTDRRIVRVTLAAKGQEMYRAGNAFIQRRVEHWLRHFTPEERAALVPLLRKLVEAMEEEG